MNVCCRESEANEQDKARVTPSERGHESLGIVLWAKALREERRSSGRLFNIRAEAIFDCGESGKPLAGVSEGYRCAEVE